MVRIRLTRLGAKKKPFYRLIVANQRSPRDGRFIEQLGWYDPKKDPYQTSFDLERVDYWIGQGAQPTETAARLIAVHRKTAAATPGSV
jgi:small subunit ribosomal protein S16